MVTWNQTLIITSSVCHYAGKCITIPIRLVYVLYFQTFCIQIHSNIQCQVHYNKLMYCTAGLAWNQTLIITLISSTYTANTPIHSNVHRQRTKTQTPPLPKCKQISHFNSSEYHLECHSTLHVHLRTHSWGAEVQNQCLSTVAILPFALLQSVASLMYAYTNK